MIEQGTLNPAAAALLALTVERGGSLAVVAEPGSAGKTTLLTAALAHLPPRTIPIFLRGSFETFGALADGRVDTSRHVLLANEISPHHPVYLWGENLAHAVLVARLGFAFYATAHGADGRGFVAMFARRPLMLPASAAATFDLVTAIEVAGRQRRVSGIWAIAERSDGGAEAIPIAHGFSSPREIQTGLRRALAGGWTPRFEPPDDAALADIGSRLDVTFSLADEPPRPGAMLARAEQDRSRGGAGSP